MLKRKVEKTEDEKEQRRLRNCEAAQRSRDRKDALLLQLQVDNEKLLKENTSLKQQLKRPIGRTIERTIERTIGRTIEPTIESTIEPTDAAIHQHLLRENVLFRERIDNLLSKQSFDSATIRVLSRELSELRHLLTPNRVEVGTPYPIDWNLLMSESNQRSEVSCGGTVAVAGAAMVARTADQMLSFSI